MPNRPVINVTSASVKSAELTGIVTVGEETAAVLSEKLGRKVEAGEQFDLGLLSYYNQNRFKRLYTQMFKIKKNILN